MIISAQIFDPPAWLYTEAGGACYVPTKMQFLSSTDSLHFAPCISYIAVLEYCVASYIFCEVMILPPKYGHYIRILHSSTSQAMTNALASMDLTAAQGHIMGYITHCDPPPCARDIEEAFHLSHPTVSGLLSRLEKKGFIEFRPDSHDRRCKRIYLLPKGLELHETMRQTILESESRLVQDFTPEEQEQFAQFLLRAIHNMGEHPCKRKHKEVISDND